MNVYNVYHTWPALSHLTPPSPTDAGFLIPGPRQGLRSHFLARAMQDISTKYASALFGITNAGASLAGLIFVYLVGVILDHTGSWWVAGKLYCCAAVPEPAVP